MVVLVGACAQGEGESFPFLLIWNCNLQLEEEIEQETVVNARDEVLERLQAQLQELMRDKDARDRRTPIQDMFIPDNHNEGGFGGGTNANSFELKTSLINMVQQEQYEGGALEDPNAHILAFVELCGTIKMNQVLVDTIKMRLFTFLLRDKAKAW